MATDDSTDLSASVTIIQPQMAFSRIVHVSDETQMSWDITDFITAMKAYTGHTTLDSFNESPYRGGYKVSIVLTA